ncbi:cation:proton antiporter family protein [Cellulomonas fimi]|uniref:Sodium/hydrogen exchanger n=1 Tax=Cellulomonas fimi (strain ATCC 484 / DSM 20113 / JCM 1341 / CCUG 24087 / LMG 16345 / NBRC 15513 / NCIMB 8980 / NCTC 7547 / NRS-133) TaxID=590998 RepID=F4GZT0_CELFA|nr:cation:proton antiporter family protein [Cellulomonas fimi]AEE47246.1 sodium/hydrogen exchanger [Cellulomonas fimi ATCC 484]NNH06961.1 cation:proton antiporter [Cellulomonas fimi]VEH35708.1 K(+)/H(+) antiporter [Cellulomonas fimi]
MAAAALYLGVALLGGLAAVLLRLPPLVGFLAAGFVLGAGDVPEPAFLEPVAELGVVLLLFAIGLKLDVRTLLRREIWLTSVAHMAVSVAIALGFLGLLAVIGFGHVAGESLGALALVGFALSFSSTVFVVKVLDDRSDTTSLYGRIAVGVLVMQDVAAVVFMSMSGGEAPTLWALLLVLLIPGAWVLHRIWDRVGHGELQALFGVTVAVVLGYGLFELVGIHGDVGALVVGVLLASHPQAGELSRSLMTFKDLMLVAFFVQIGLHGTPQLLEVALALLLLLLLPFQVAAYALLLWLMRLRRRTSFLAGLVLSNYSEFGIIVVAVGASTGLLDAQWVVVVSLAVAFSFGLSAIVNRRGVELASRLSRLLPARDSDRLHPDDRLVDVGDADALVLGLGRVGASTYARLRDEYRLSVVGVEHDRTRVAALEDEGYEVVRADATDLEFWNRVQRAGRVKVAVLAMPFHNANLIALARLQAAGFAGKVAAVARYDDDVSELQRHGADAVFHLYGSAGSALADHAAEVLLQEHDGGKVEPHPPARPGDEIDVLDPLERRAEPA